MPQDEPVPASDSHASQVPFSTSRAVAHSQMAHSLSASIAADSVMALLNSAQAVFSSKDWGWAGKVGGNAGVPSLPTGEGGALARPWHSVGVPPGGPLADESHEHTRSDGILIVRHKHLDASHLAEGGGLRLIGSSILWHRSRWTAFIGCGWIWGVEKRREKW